MVVLDESKENIIADVENQQQIDNSSREERRRTGRYLALGIAISLLVLGFYHAVVYRATKYAALLGAALIMFLYLLWLLYASHRKKKISILPTEMSESPTQLTEVTTTNMVKSNEIPGNEQIEKKLKGHKPQHYDFKRTYSIA